MADPIQQAGGTSDIRGEVLDAISALGGDPILVHSAWPGSELSKAILELQTGGISTPSELATVLMNRAHEARRMRLEKPLCVTPPRLCVTPVNAGQENGKPVTQETQETQRLRRHNETQRDTAPDAGASLLGEEEEEPANEEKTRTRNAAAWFKQTAALPFPEFVVKADLV